MAVSGYMVPRSLPSGPRRPGHLPVRLWIILQLMERAFVKGREYACADLFAGKCAISKTYRRKGLSACALDTEIDARDESWLLAAV